MKNKTPEKNDKDISAKKAGKPLNKNSDRAAKPKKKPKNKKSGLKRYGWRGALIFTEIAAVIVFVLAIALGFSVWRLKSGPVDISFTKNYIESSLQDETSGFFGTMESAALYWPDLTGPLYLGLQNGVIRDKNGAEVLSVGEVALSLSRRYLLLGQIRPKAIIIKQPSLRIVRTEDNQIDFGLGALSDLGELSPENDGDVQEDIVGEILAQLQNVSDKTQYSPLSQLETFAIEEARAVIEDHKLGASWFFPDFSIVFSEVEQGLRSDFEVLLPASQDGQDSFIQLSAIVDKETKTVNLNGELSHFDTGIFAGKIDDLEILRDQDVIIDAKITGVLDNNLNPQQINVVASSERGEVLHQDISDEPVPYQNFTASITYLNDDKQSLSLNLNDTQITLKDLTLHLTGNLEEDVPDDGGDQKYKGRVALSIDDTPHSALEPLWPKFLEGDSSEEWVVQKMSGATLSDLKAETNVSLFKKDGEWDGDISGLVAQFSFADAAMDYRAPLPAVTKAFGEGRFDLDSDTLVIGISKAGLGGMDVSKTGLTFKDVAAEGKGSVDMSINLNGSLRSVFEYISLEPIDLKDELDMDVSKVKGDTDLKVEMSFPTKDDLEIEEIKMDISGTVRDGYLPDMLEGLPLSGGPFKVDVNNERYTVNGSGKLGEHSVTLDWLEYLSSKGKPYKHQAKAKVIAKESLRKHFGIDLSDFITGSVPLNLTYTGFAGDKSEIQATGDMTQAEFFVKSFDYTKPAGQTGDATFKAFLSNNNLRQVNVAKASAPNFKLEDTQILFRGTGENTEVSQANIKRFVIGETIASAVIDMQKNGAMKIEMNGPYLDLRPFMDKENDTKEVYNDPPVTLSLAVDQMRTAEEETVQYAKIYADIDNKGRFNQLEMDAIAGKGDIYLRYKPNEKGVRTFRFEADDAGAALKAFDIYKSILGGKLVIYGEPINDVYDRNLKGVAQITNFKVVDAPSLARLLSSMSLTGVMGLLNNEGLSFAKLEANFDWLYRQEGALLVLKDGRTSGNSLGLTFDGVFDNAAQTVDVSGTIIPLSGINNVIGSIPVLGDVITGGTGALFAATYSMKGKTEEPKISVNPLSVLTPGILRRILFEQ